MARKDAIGTWSRPSFLLAALSVVFACSAILTLTVQIERHVVCERSSLVDEMRREEESESAVKSLDKLVQGSEDLLSMPRFPMPPAVSVIITAFNNVNRTLKALSSISRMSLDIPFEVIVYDDASSDETPLVLPQIKNLIMMSGTSTLQYAGANNHAVFNMSSPSKYIWFLNNDIEVGRDTLSTLVQTLETHLHAGAVGCKLVYPTGTLQEAGSMVFNQGSCAGYGRDQSPIAPEYNYLRSVDYCSACCLLVRRDVFQQCGGFDADNFPHYYEDTDLQLKIRYEKGLDVLYQPLAEVVHHEYGSIPKAEAVAKMKHSQATFSSKWRHVIRKQHFMPDEANFLCGRDRLRDAKSILFVDQKLGESNSGSGFGRALQLIEALATLKAKVTMFPMLDRRPPKSMTRIQQMGVEVIWDANETWEYSEELLATRTQELCNFISTRAGLFDGIIVSRPPLFSKAYECIRRLQPQSYIIFDSEALWFVRDETRALALNETDLLMAAQAEGKKELQLYALANECIVVSQSDKERVLDFHRGSNVALNLNIISYHANPLSTSTEFAKRHAILFIGAFHNEMYYNGEAIMYFALTIYPRIKQQMNKAELVIVGRQAPSEILDLHDEALGINVLGNVDDLASFYESALVFVAPHQYGAGIQNKVIESLAHGIPVVAMDHVARAIGAENVSSGIMIATDSDTFADCVIDVYRDEVLWQGLQEGGIKFIREHFSTSGFLASVAEMLDRIPKTCCTSPKGIL